MPWLCNDYVMAIKYKKESIHVTVSPYIKKQAEELVATEEFSSMSDLVSIALAEFIGRYKRERLETEANDLVLSEMEDAEPAVIAESVEKATFK